VVRLNQSILRAPRRPGPRPNAFLFTLAGFASSLIVAGYFAHAHPAVAVLSSLWSGFAPLIGWCVLLLLVSSLLISFLVATVDRTFTDEDDRIVAVSHLKSRWRHVTYSLTCLPAHSLSLNEHSPPAFLLP
jgi:hypothetical protein